MNLQTFKASTMAEALSQVKSNMGHDAVILHTRTYHIRNWLGLRRKEIVEITAGRGLPTVRRQAAAPVQRPPSRPMIYRQPLPGPQAGFGNVAAAPNVVTALPAINLAANRQQILDHPATSTAAMLSLTEEVNGMKRIITDLATQVRRQQAPAMPEELVPFYAQLIENHVAEELALELMKGAQKMIRPEHLAQSDFVREKLAELVEKLLPTSGPIQRTKPRGPHVVALIGPTGVGKTTTLAKLAANLKICDNHKVGLITIDTYRIAAIEQLRKYAEILGSPLKVVHSPEELRDAITAMSDCEYILIDTAGRSPKDTLKLNELKSFLASAAPDEVHLVLSTTASEECAELAIERFGHVKFDKIIMTKLDEASHVGVVLNVVRKVSKSLSYVTTGQDVPKDIEVGQGRKLARLILGSNNP